MRISNRGGPQVLRYARTRLHSFWPRRAPSKHIICQGVRCKGVSVVSVSRQAERGETLNYPNAGYPMPPSPLHHRCQRGKARHRPGRADPQRYRVCIRLYPRRTHRRLGIAPGRVHPQHCRIVPVRKVKGHKHRRGHHRDRRSNRWRCRILRRRRRWVPRRLPQIRVRKSDLSAPSSTSAIRSDDSNQAGSRENPFPIGQSVNNEEWQVTLSAPHDFVFGPAACSPGGGPDCWCTRALDQSWATACRASVCGSGRRRARPGTLGAGWAKFSVCTPDEWANHWS